MQAIHTTSPDGSSTGSSNPAEPGVYPTSDLARLVEKWPTLPAHIKAAVMALVNTGTPAKPDERKEYDDLLPWERRIVTNSDGE